MQVLELVAIKEQSWFLSLEEASVLHISVSGEEEDKSEAQESAIELKKYPFRIWFDLYLFLISRKLI